MSPGQDPINGLDECPECPGWAVSLLVQIAGHIVLTRTEYLKR